MIETIARGVCIKSGQILLCQTKGAPIRYLPGGHVEFGEGARQALEREITEELALDSTAGDFLGMVEHHFLQKGERHSEWNAVFMLDIPGLEPGEEVAAAEDHISFEWCALDKIAGSGLEPDVLCGLLAGWAADRLPPQRWVKSGL